MSMHSFGLNCRGRLVEYYKPVVMGILNVTADSFYDGGRYNSAEALLAHARALLVEGADILDVGVVSTRPGAQLLEPGEEAKKLAGVVRLLRKELPSDVVISVDTCFSLPAQQALDEGADIVNDISGGLFDEEMFPMVARRGVPYVLMHNIATPDRMQQQARYDDVVREVAQFFSHQLHRLYTLGAQDVILDPGFGFGKTMEHNYQLFANIPTLVRLFPHQPLLVALSRKSMIYKLLGITPQEALAGTVALDAQALLMGAAMIRVHDVKEAVQTVRLYEQFRPDLQ